MGNINGDTINDAAGTGAPNFSAGLKLVGGTTLDAYSEGTWTPNIDTTGGTSPSYSFSIQSASYKRIGNIVVATFFLRWGATGGGTGNAKVTGLPFAASATAAQVCYASLYTENVNFSATSPFMLLGFSAVSSTDIFLSVTTDGGVTAGLPLSDLNTGTFNKDLRGTLIYFV